MTPDTIEEALAGLRRNPQTYRHWWRNLRFRQFSRRWWDWRALAASGTMPQRLVAAHGRLLEKEWSEIETFFARYEANRARLDALHEARGPGRSRTPDNDDRALAREWKRLEAEPCLSGDPGCFTPLEDGLGLAEERLRQTLAQPAEGSSTASGSITDLREEAGRLLGEGMVLVNQLSLGKKVRASVMQDRRRILELLENGDSACAFWWAKDLHAWLVAAMEERRPPPPRQPPAASSTCEARHARFLAIQGRLEKLLRP